MEIGKDISFSKLREENDAVLLLLALRCSKFMVLKLEVAMKPV